MLALTKISEFSDIGKCLYLFNYQTLAVLLGSYSADFRFMSSLEVTNTHELYKAVLQMLHRYDPAKHIHLMQALGDSYLSMHQFCQVIGKVRLWQALPQRLQRQLPRVLITDTQINNVARSYIQDEHFGGYGEDISMWNFYNLLTSANKSSYIDSFLDRSYNATELACGITAALNGNERYRWFID